MDTYKDLLPEGENYYGLENVNTLSFPNMFQLSATMCYANSSLQVLYHCTSFREQILNMKLPPDQENGILFELQELFK